MGRIFGNTKRGALGAHIRLNDDVGDVEISGFAVKSLKATALERLSADKLLIAANKLQISNNQLEAQVESLRLELEALQEQQEQVPIAGITAANAVRQLIADHEKEITGLRQAFEHTIEDSQKQINQLTALVSALQQRLKDQAR